MALIFLEHTRCGLCNEILHSDELITGLPPSANTEHILYKYFDQGFHQTCFDNWDKKEEVLNLIAEEKLKFEQSAAYKEMQMKFGTPPPQFGL